MIFLVKMQAANRSNAIYIYIYIFFFFVYSVKAVTVPEAPSVLISLVARTKGNTPAISPLRPPQPSSLFLRNISEKSFQCKIRVRNSGAGNGCANFMGAWKKCVLSAGKSPCP